MKLRHIQAVVFDLFHTLTGPDPDRPELPWTSDVLGIDRRRWNDLLLTRSRWRLAGEETDACTIVRKLAHEIDPTIPEERIQEATRVRIQRFADSLARIPPENIETLRHLKASGLRLALISNADVMEAAPWPTCALAGLFDVEVFSCAVGLVKPEPAIFAHCINALGVSPSACLFVGDGGSNELEGAKAAGMSTVFVSGVIATLWPERIAERRAISDHHIERIPELMPLLGLNGRRTA